MSSGVQSKAKFRSMPRSLPAWGRYMRWLDQVIGSASLTGGDIGKFPRIKGRAELVGAGICFGSQRWRGIDENACFRRNNRRVLELKVNTADVIMQGIAVAGEYGGLHVE